MARAPLRPIADDDLEAVLALNQAHVPAVGGLDREGLDRLVRQAETAVLADLDGDLGGFVLALPPGTSYGSPNYRWFSDRYDEFVYVDRIVVDTARQRVGLGHRLYDAVEAATSAPILCAEVNVRPRNGPSLAFHERRGFAPVGEQDTDDGAKRVVLLAKALR